MNSKEKSVVAKVKKVSTVNLDERSKKILAIRAALKERDDARDNGDYGKSDVIRDKLVNDYDIEIFDQKNGPSGFKFKDGSSTKLSAGVNLPTTSSTTTKDAAPSSASKKRSREEDDEDSAKASTTTAKKVKVSDKTTASTNAKKGKPISFVTINLTLLSCNP
jgi:hypothetical protein